MKISMKEASKKVFKKEFYGYSVEEVKTYIDSLAQQLHQVTQENNALKEQVMSLENQLSEYKKTDQILRETISTATQMSEIIKEDAKKEAHHILQEARNEAEKSKSEALQSLKIMYVELSELKNAKENFERNLKSLAQAHIDFIERSTPPAP
jgi:cell division initiation protein